jgi:hypothetical protein
MTSAFANSFQPGNVIPERDQRNPHAGILQPGAKIRDLSTLSGAVDARKTCKFTGLAFVLILHRYAPTYPCE